MEASQAAAQLARQASKLTIADLFRQQAARSPSSPALQQGERCLSYDELNQRVNRVAHALKARGVRHGDRVAVLSENRIEYIELELAAAKLGAILACQNWRQSDDELEYCMRLVAPRLALASGRHAPALERIRHGVANVLVFERDYEAMLAASPSHEPQPDMPLDPEDGLIILYTSGTTGMPKGALISQRAMAARGMVGRIDGLIQPGKTFIAWAPLFHMVSTDQCYGTLTTGGKVIVMDGLDVPQLVAVIARETIGHLTLIPGMVDRVIEEIQRTGIEPKGVNTLGCMADLVPREQIAQITTLLRAPFLNSFGSTETGSPPASRATIPVGVLPQKLSKLQNSNCVIRLVDPDDKEVEDGKPGELAMRGPTLFSGYWGAPEATAKDFVNGWFHMGDVFVRNPDGSLDYVDRRKYLIKSGGENIYPAEIERVLLAHPSIADAAVVRKPDPQWGEVPVAFVVKKDEALSAKDVVDACRGKVANYKLPKDVIFIKDEEVPRSTTGKIKRHELEQVLAGAAPRA